MTLRPRLKYALAAYAAIALLAWFTLEAPLSYMVLLVLAALAAKSYIAVRRQETN